MPLVRPPRRACSPAPLKLPNLRFGSCSLNGAPIGCPATGFFVARFDPPAFLDALVFLATLCLLVQSTALCRTLVNNSRQQNQATPMPRLYPLTRNKKAGR